jgi:hypothetical protein
MRKRRLCVVVLAFVVGLAPIASATTQGQDERKQSARPSAKKNSGHCISPSGLDVNEFWGVSIRVVAPFCTQLRTGEAWTATAAWVVAETFESVPEGFVPAGETPLDDFQAKASLKYVVDPGTRQERTYVFTDTSRVAVREVNGGPLDGAPVLNTITMGSLRPLSAGRHVVETYWAFSAMHCDGIADNPEENCLAGELLYHRVEIDVTRGSR